VHCENCIFATGGAFVVGLVGHTAMLSFLTYHGYNPVAPDRPQAVDAVHDDDGENCSPRTRFALGLASLPTTNDSS